MTVITAPVRKTLELTCSPERAFETFTNGIDSWWPKADYSIGGTSVVEVVFEPREGGRIFEIHDDGKEFDWGHVISCERPERLVFTWHPGTDPHTPTEVEVRFTATGSGTLVELEHRHWDRLGDRAGSVRGGYEGGWVEVLAAYGRAAA